MLLINPLELPKGCANHSGRSGKVKPSHLESAIWASLTVFRPQRESEFVASAAKARDVIADPQEGCPSTRCGLSEILLGTVQLTPLLQIEPEVGPSPHSFLSRRATQGVTGRFSSRYESEAGDFRFGPFERRQDLLAAGVRRMCGRQAELLDHRSFCRCSHEAQMSQATSGYMKQRSRSAALTRLQAPGVYNIVLLSHPLAASGATHSNSGNWWRNQVNCRLA